MNSISTLAGVISGLATMALLFKPVFGSAAEFWECLRYWMTPDFFSWISGEGMEDFFAELKLGVWCVCGIAVGLGVSSLIGSI